MFCLRACYLEPFEPQSNQLLCAYRSPRVEPGSADERRCRPRSNDVCTAHLDRLVSAHPLRTSPKPLLESSCKLVRINICAVWTRHADAQRWPSLAALLAESPLRYALSHPLHRELPVALYSAMVRPFGSLFCGPLVKRRNEVEPLMRSLSTSLSWILAATDAESEDASARTMQADLYRALREMDERHVLPSSYKTSLLAASRRPALLSSHDALVAEAIRDLAEFERAERPEAAEEVEMLEFPPNNDKERNAAEEEWLKKCDVACLEEFERSWRGNRAGKMQDGAVCSPGGEGWASLPCFRDEGAQPAGALALADGWGGANAMPW
ncbi:hypothetical protein ACQY0O_002502 [Thecaphora frezii]